MPEKPRNWGTSSSEWSKLKSDPALFQSNWDECGADLFWGQKEDKPKHKNALRDFLDGHEGDGLDKLKDIQSHNPRAQRNYDLCHSEDLGKFWKLAFEVLQES